ncbi:MAG: signal peptidase II [Lachnospiraceae bacterium]|nr:signal peptidase II [Lachnospiraceae bacterium]
MNRLLRNPIFIAVLTLLLIGLDQFSKALAVRFLMGSDPLVLWDGVFELRYLENRGAAFGLLQGQRTFFLVIGIVVFIAVLFLFRYLSPERLYWPLRLIAVFILAGAWGNMIDRIRNGYVVDFFYFKLIDFPIFNVADIYVTVGTAVLILLVLFYYKDEDLNDILVKRPKKEKQL